MGDWRTDVWRWCKKYLQECWVCENIRVREVHKYKHTEKENKRKCKNWPGHLQRKRKWVWLICCSIKNDLVNSFFTIIAALHSKHIFSLFLLLYHLLCTQTWTCTCMPYSFFIVVVCGWWIRRNTYIIPIHNLIIRLLFSFVSNRMDFILRMCVSEWRDQCSKCVYFCCGTNVIAKIHYDTSNSYIFVN